ncbi:MAG TPA: type 2 isopentenyl-diphosphate Delta-isomerase [Thermoanaerobaculia bacterium]|nr:type 2 isopentenyl-diphosphate Delta-isomerase [Thermoanaerobaculia bacterium]
MPTSSQNPPEAPPAERRGDDVDREGGELEARDRKAEHIDLALERRMQAPRPELDRLRFGHCALPEIDFDDVELGCEFLGRRLRAPLLVSCMTGGTGAAEMINRHLAEAAEYCRIALGVGSQRKALEDPETARSFEVRHHAPSVPVVGNLGAVQLNYGYGVAECRRAIDMIDADALALHLNPLQEAIQPEGQTRFANLLPKIGEVVGGLGAPVIVKEIGNGISGGVGRRLRDVGVEIVDTAGSGGTSWARIEASRADDLDLGELFADWGVSTATSIRELAAIDGLTVIGSGGLRTGIDVAKAIALGASLVGMAYPFLEAATESAEAVVERIERITRELRITMFCLGVRTLDELRRVPLHAA